MDLSNILFIAGKPDLSELVSRTKNGAVVMNLVSKQKYHVFHHDRISSLGEIRIFTDNGEAPLNDVMAALKKHYSGNTTAFDPKKEESSKLFSELEQVLPEYDRNRVHASDVKKLFSWYNVLLAADKLNDDAPSSETGEVKPETKADAKAPEKNTRSQKTAAPKATAKPKAAPKRTTTAKKAI
ncbi:MAG: hypothetical protein AUK63_1560 [bacterium P3]|nr:MAG: hypothetical protein AUK63_1560 [bacterium P3]KWW41044.1 MAG: hypothetical protein F083_1211 [bacterium F083]